MRRADLPCPVFVVNEQSVETEDGPSLVRFVA